MVSVAFELNIGLLYTAAVNIRIFREYLPSHSLPESRFAHSLSMTAMDDMTAPRLSEPVNGFSPNLYSSAYNNTIISDDLIGPALFLKYLHPIEGGGEGCFGTGGPPPKQKQVQMDN